MNTFQNKPLLIYVSGPYSPQTNETDPARKQAMIEENIKKAEQIGVDIAKKGHLPFIPHTMMRGWEGKHFKRQEVLDICVGWVKKCDALYFIGRSDGAEEEWKTAVELHKPVYRKLDDLPAIPAPLPVLSEEAFEAYKLEYEQCMESYRHTYNTIWQAGGFFTALSVAIIALATVDELRIFFPLPVILWVLGIFIPMNRYGEWRAQRLVELEGVLNNSIPGLKMSHFTDFYNKRNKNQMANLLIGQWRVSHVVTLFALSLTLVQVCLILVSFIKWIEPFLKAFFVIP